MNTTRPARSVQRYRSALAKTGVSMMIANTASHSGIDYDEQKLRYCDDKEMIGGEQLPRCRGAPQKGGIFVTLP